jgi:hypothetical protein
MIYIYLLTIIYREGYYIKHTDDLDFIISDDLGISSDTVQQVMTFLLKRSMFNEQLFKSDAILTSDGIQKRWQEAVKVRAAKRPIEVGKYWLLPKEETIPHIKRTNFSANSENLPLNSENLPLNSENLNNKVKKSKVNNPPNPLSEGGGRNIWKDRFFEKYTIFEKKNYNDDGIDYEILYREFDKSMTLQKMWSFPKVVKLYSQISNGEFRDTITEQQQILQGIDERANRERYFTAKRNQAETKAEYLRESCCAKKPQIKAYAKELRRLDIEIAKAEVKQDKQLLEYLNGERCDYERKIEEALNEIGYTKSDLEVKYDCEKCQDTGWLPNGQACDCYKK